MRFHSTPESALNGEITKLAIVECIASVAIYLAIGLYSGTFRYLALAVIMAPLMLFRTEASVDWGLRVYRRCLQAQLRLLKSRGRPLPLSLIMAVSFAISAFGIRIIAPLYWVIRQPLRTIGEMPRNWVRQSLCTDFAYPPEMLPLDAVKGLRMGVPSFAHLLRGLLRQKGAVPKIGYLLALLPTILLGYLPSLVYRVSFKATSVAYLPFIWVAHATLRNPLPANTRLERITKGELEKVRRVLSWGIIATLAAKFGFVLGLVDWNRIEEKFPSKKLVQSFVVPDGWPWWQITLGADALLTFFLLFFADAALARLNTQQAWREQTVLGTVSTVSFLRAAMSLLTISHFFRIALVAVAPGPLHRLLAG